MRPLHLLLAAPVALAALAAAAVALMSARTEEEIDGLRDAAAREAAAAPAPRFEAAAVATLPEPVQRWAKATFTPDAARCTLADVEMQGRFRRPRTEAFAATTARQRLAAGSPALVFDATTPMLPGVWARAWDGYVDGRMSMKARVLSALTVVDEHSTPALDRTSLRRWLLESAFCPHALLPGGAVRWQAIDAGHARAVVRRGDVEAALVATFDEAGRLVRFDAEEDGDLAQPYHGSGERVERSDFRLVRGAWVPFRFVVSRVSGGRAYPFWDGEVTALRQR